MESAVASSRSRIESTKASSLRASFRRIARWSPTRSLDHRRVGAASSAGGDVLRLGHRGLVEQAQLGRALDRVAPRGDSELPVDGDRLRLDRVARDEEALADLAEGQVR